MSDFKVGDTLQTIVSVGIYKKGAVGKVTGFLSEGHPILDFTDRAAVAIHKAHVRRVGTKLFPKKITSMRRNP